MGPIFARYSSESERDSTRLGLIISSCKRVMRSVVVGNSDEGTAGDEWAIRLESLFTLVENTRLSVS